MERAVLTARYKQAVRDVNRMRDDGSLPPRPPLNREDLIETILCDWDWSISRDEAEKLADKQIAARIAARIIEREDGK